MKKMEHKILSIISSILLYAGEIKFKELYSTFTPEFLFMADFLLSRVALFSFIFFLCVKI